MYNAAALKRKRSRFRERFWYVHEKQPPPALQVRAPEEYSRAHVFQSAAGEAAASLQLSRLQMHKLSSYGCLIAAATHSVTVL
jgi:hypothetical protein